MKINQRRDYLVTDDVVIYVLRAGPEFYCVRIENPRRDNTPIRDHCSAAGTLGVADAIARGYSDMYALTKWQVPVETLFFGRPFAPRDIVR